MTSKSDGTDRYIHFGEFVFDTDSDELYRGEKRVVIQPQPAKLLRLFLSRDGRLLSQAEITSYIWPKTIVDYEQRVRSAVGDIRTALDDDHEHPRYIETVSRRGYRFIFPIQSKIDKLGFQTRRRWVILAAIALGALFAFGLYVLVPDSEIGASDKNRVVLVVLPVSEIVTGDTGKFPVDGLTHELIAQTAGLAPSALAVIGRTSAMKYKGTTLTTAQIASDLGADYLLETTIGELETGLRATSTLVESASGQVVWSTHMDGSFGDLQAFEVEIAYGVGQALGIKPEVDMLATTATDSTDSEAYEAYLTGLYLISQKSTEQKALSYDFFREAITQDPIFAQAYLGVARSIVFTERPEAEFWEAIDKALSWMTGQPMPITNGR